MNATRKALTRGGLALVLLAGLTAQAQTPADVPTLAELRAQAAANLPAEGLAGLEPDGQAAEYGGLAEPANIPLVDPATQDLRAVTDLYNGLLPSGNGFWLWTYGGSETAYWALDDGRMGPGAVLAGGGHVTELEFAFGLHADFPNDVLRPIVYVTFYNAPPDPVAGATNPVVEPPTPAQSIWVLFSPITLPSAGFWSYRSGMLDLAGAGLDFDLDETFYVEIVPAEWSSYPVGSPVIDPDVCAVFTGPGTVTYGTNQNNMWSDSFWVRNTACVGSVYGNNDGFYNHPAEMDVCNHAMRLNQSGIILRGLECVQANRLELSINEPDDLCVKPGETVTVTLSQACLPGLVRGYQAFLQFNPGMLSFGSGAYIVPLPYGLPIIVPIAATGANIDLAAGIDDTAGQLPTSSSADLVTLTFTAGSTEGVTSVGFRLHDPPTRFSDPFGQPVVPLLIDSPQICIDGTNPQIVCPANTNGQCVGDVPPPATDYASFVALGGGANAVDDGCWGEVAPIITHQGDATSGTGCVADPYVVLRTYRATDCAGNYVECVQTITIIDDTAPVISGCPANINTNSDPGVCGAVVTWTAPTATDNCGSVSIVQTAGPASGSFFAVGGPYAITYTATDACGNTSLCTFTVTVTDDEDPVITCPANATVECDDLSFLITGFEGYLDGALVLFRNPRLSGSTVMHLAASPDIARVTSAVTPFSGAKSYEVRWQFLDNTLQRWMRLTTANTAYVGNPTVPIDQPIRVRMRVDSGSFRLCMGLRETGTTAAWGQNGGSSSVFPIEFVGAASKIGEAPQGVLVTAMPGVWQEFIFDPLADPILAMTGDGVLQSPSGKVVFEHLAFSSAGDAGPFVVYIDDVEILSPDTGTATATDNCGIASIASVDVDNLPGCSGTGTIARTWTATDLSGNTDDCVQTITVVDTTPPTATQGAIAACYPDAASADAAALAATTNLADNCSTTVTKAVQSGAGTCDTSIVIRVTDECGNFTDYTYYTRVDGTAPTATQGIIAACYADAASANAAALAATTSLTDNCGAAGVTKAVFTGAGDCDTSIVIRVTDSCGNYTDYTYNTRVDGTDPVISGCPGNITVYADPGGCDAVVTWTAPTATDNCLAVTLSSDHNPGDTFPSGTTVVTYTATDTCGNDTTCTFTVTVQAYNQMVVDVELSPTMMAGPLTRCITFDLWNCPGTAPLATENEVLTFTSGLAHATIEVACGDYDCVTARDGLHTLRRTDDSLGISGTQYVADFTGGDWLVGGNLNGDNWIDILDFGVFSFQWAASYGSGNTTCLTTYPHADINGDGSVATADFTFIQVNFLQTHEANCCGASGFRGEGEDGPITEITVAELQEMGLSELIAGDLNGDGWLDQADIAAFLMGARPGLSEAGDPVPVDATDITDVSETDRPAPPSNHRGR